MTIRTINRNELSGLLRLYEQLHENPYPEIGPGLLTLWDRIIADKSQSILVAVEGKQIVSSCVVIIVLNLTHNQRPYALMENVVTVQA